MSAQPMHEPDARITPPGEDIDAEPKPFDTSRLWPLVSASSLVVVLFVWWLLTTGLQIVPGLYFPRPSEVISSAATLGDVVIRDALATLLRVVVSWIVGSTLGVVVGLLMVRSKLAFYSLTPLIEGLRPIPPVALIPFVILWFGIGDSGKIALGALGCFMVMVINAVVSAGNVPPVYRRAARSLGASPRQVYRTVIFPAIVPELVSGLRIGAALAFAIVVAAELLGAEAGVGRLIMLSSRTLNTPVVLLGTVVIGVEAFLLERLIRVLTTRATIWADKGD